MADESNWIAESFQVLADKIQPDKLIYFEGGYRSFLKGRPYAIGFLLPDNPVTIDRDLADYVISYESHGNAEEIVSTGPTVYLSATRRGERGAN